jgi:hypothetical protein
MSGLPEVLSLAILVAGTLEYAFVMRHREERRRSARLDELSANLGHQALMRMRLLERARPVRAWGSFGTRFR